MFALQIDIVYYYAMTESELYDEYKLSERVNSERSIVRVENSLEHENNVLKNVEGN